MVDIEKNKMEKVMCDICHVGVAYLKRHQLSNKHIANQKIYEQEQIIKEQQKKLPPKELSKNTIRNIKYSEDKIKELKGRGIDIKDHNKVYEELNKKFLPNTVDLILRMGLLRQLEEDDKPSLSEIINENKAGIINNKKPTEKTFEDLFTKDFELDKNDRIIFHLYCMLPLRMNEFIKLKIYSDGVHDDESHIVLENNTLYLFNTKTGDSEVKLKDDIINYIKEHYVPDTGESIFPRSESAFKRMLAKLNTNTMEIRRIYANAQMDRAYGARILNHQLGTHFITYLN